MLGSPAWKPLTMDGNRRWCRTYASYHNCPFPSSAEKLFFILVYLKQAPTQMMHATMFGITQPSANRWIQRTLTALRAALATYHVLPARDIDILNDFLHRDAESGAEMPTLFFMTEQNDLLTQSSDHCIIAAKTSPCD